MKNYKELLVWQKAFNLSLDVYRLTKNFPKDESFGLSSQMRRSGISIFSNIAEGHGRGSNKDFARFLNIALGSCNELEGQILISVELGYISADQEVSLTNRCSEIGRMLNGLIKKLLATDKA